MSTKVLAVIQGNEGSFVPVVTELGTAIPCIVRDASNLIEGVGPTFVFRPGGVAGGNVYTTWTSMMAAVALIAGPKFIQVDSSLATANVDPGAWNVDECTFYGGVNDTGAASNVLNFPNNGCSLTFSNLYLRGGTNWQSASSTPIVTVGANHNALVIADNLAVIATSGTAPFFKVTGGLLDIEGEAFLGDGSHAVIETDAATATFLSLWGNSVVKAGALTGTSAAILTATSDLTLGEPQGKAPTIAFSSQAFQTSYTPTQASNWNPAPQFVGGVPTGALDVLVAPNFHQAISAAPNAAFTTFALGANLTRTRAGLFRITAALSGTDSTSEVVSVTLVRDGATVIGPTVKTDASTTGGVPSFGVTFTWTDHITDVLAHTWSVNAVGASGGTLSVPTGGVGIEAVEQ